MSVSRPGFWRQQEIRDEQEAKKLRQPILNTFWGERVEKWNQISVDLIKGFLKGRPPEKWNNKEVDRDSWPIIVDNEFKLIKSKNDYFRFINLFSHISNMDIVSIDKGERFGLAKQNASREDIAVQITNQDKENISDYMADKHMSAVVSIASEGQAATICTDGNTKNSIFSIHSVGKVFTNVLILLLVEEGIIKERDLNELIKISDTAKSKLPSSVVNQLQKVTLHQVMIHHGGFGDGVLGTYVKAIQSVLKENRPLPEINNLEDFLPYASDVIFDEPNYSNLGFLLVGLAAEYAYAEDQKKQAEPLPLNFNALLEKFIQKPAGMTSLSDKSPAEAKVNDSTTILEPTPEARHLVANASGGYWTSAEDLQKFGVWLYNKCQEPNFGRLVTTYGKEFHLDANTLGHKGENPSASAMLSISLKHNHVIAALSNSSRSDAHVLEEAIRKNIFTKKAMTLNKSPASFFQPSPEKLAKKKQPHKPEVTPDEMAKSAFGQASNTAKDLSKKKR